MTVVISGDTGISPVTPTGTSALVDGMTVGRGAGEVSTNTAVGASALAANTSGVQDTAIGASALAVATGGYNTAVGYQAGYSVTTGIGHVFLGRLAGASSAGITGDYSVGVGLNSLYSLTSGSNNTAVGTGSLSANTTASNNTAVGYQAGYTGTVGGRNTYIGLQAGYSANNTTKDAGNTYVGAKAGYSTTTAQGNTFMGGDGSDQLGSSGYSVTTGSYNTFLGVSSGYYVTTGGKNTIIGGYNGNQGGLDIRTSSNYIVLSDGDGNPHAYSTKGGASTDFNVNSSTGGNPSVSLRVNTALKWTLWEDAGNDKFQITDADYSNGVQLSQNSNSWAGYSDSRLKQNVVGLSSGLDVVLNLEPVTYEWKKDSKADVGFIAQQVKTFVPLAVVGDEEDYSQSEDGKVSGAMGIMHDKLVPYLVKAIQELKSEFDAYKSTHP